MHNCETLIYFTNETKNKAKMCNKQLDAFYDFLETHAVPFNGSDYVPELDDKRLTGQVKDIYTLMVDGVWRTLGEIEEKTKHPQASISAQLRHLRKKRFGKNTVLKRRRGDETQGLFEYQLLINTEPTT